MRILRNIAAIVGCVLMFASCDDDVSYAELLNQENYAVNNFLADQVVYLDIPADTVFEVGPDAPYYRLDEDGQLYMQVIDAGTPGNKVRNNEKIYYRYKRWNLEYYKDGTLPQGTGNMLSLSPAYFLYGNSNSIYLYGSGIQAPLEFLPIDCEVNLVVKSTVGMQTDQTDVIPYLYKLVYQRPM